MTDSEIRQLAKQYAERFDVDNGDSLEEYCERASLDVYPPRNRSGVALSGRADFRRLVKAAVRELQKSGVG